MQHRLPVSDLKLGMYIVSIDGSWLSNPFWRTRFRLTNSADIARLKNAGIDTVVIDDTLGIGLVVPIAPGESGEPGEPDDGASEADDAAPAGPPLVVERRAKPRTRRPVSEVDRARETVERSKVAVMSMFGEARLGRVVSIDAVVPLVDEIAASIKRDRSAILNVARLKDKNEYTYMHSVAVCALMMTLARQIGLDEAEVQQAGLAGLLHDIGKMTVPEDVLDKPGALDAEQRRIIEEHPQSGHLLLSDIGTVSQVALDVCLHHHERVDGTGYPFGLTQQQLSLYARMGAICDVYDAVTSERPYKSAWPPAVALARMSGWDGHFDPQLLHAFTVAIGIFPIGSLVRLHSNRLAIVLTGDPDAPTSPGVRAFFNVVDAAFDRIADVATHNAAGGDPIIRGERGDAWFGDDWPTLRDRVLAGAPLGELTARFSATGLGHDDRRSVA